MSNFNKEFNKRKNMINDNLGNIFKKDNILEEGSSYSLMNDGKRIRPIIFTEVYKIFKDLDESALSFAQAIELVHNYSLVHDDLPSMDDDDLRRGKPTAHIKYGEDMGILIGDGLLNKSMEMVLKAISLSDNPKGFVRAGSYLYSQSGYEGMILGQVLDIGNKLESKEDFLDMYDKKTCGLIKASSKCGAICAGADDEKIELCEEFGYNLGLAFQLRDDLLDYEEDLESNKLTYATIIKDKKEIERLVEVHSNKALECLEALDGEVSFLSELTKQLIDRSV